MLEQKAFKEFLEDVKLALLNLERRDLADAPGLPGVIMFSFIRKDTPESIATKIHEQFPYVEGKCACCGRETK